MPITTAATLPTQAPALCLSLDEEDLLFLLPLASQRRQTMDELVLDLLRAARAKLTAGS